MVMSYKPKIVIGLRSIQIICIGFTITGILWSTSDLLLATVLVNAPVTPLSVLMMLYGTFGAFLNEVAIRLMKRKKGDFLPQKE